MSDKVTRRGYGRPPTGIAAFLRLLVERRALLSALVARDLRDSHQGTVFSRWWMLIHPLAVVALYLFVFGHVFAPRFGGTVPEAPDFAVFLVAGLSVWLTAQAALVKAAGALVGSASLVKQVVFPIELLPVRAVLAAFLPLVIGLGVVAAYSALRFGIVSPLAALSIVVAFFLLVTLTGLGLLFAALTVFVRDTRDALQMFSSFGLFLTPILYLPGTLPSWFETALFLNPFSHHVWCLHDIFFHRALVHPGAWLGMPAVSVVTLWVGVTCFQRTRTSFGDAL